MKQCICTDCNSPAEDGRRCWPCESKWLDANRPPTITQLQRTYTHLIEAFHGLEQYLRLVEMPAWKDRDPRNEPNGYIPAEQVRETIAVLRDHWKHKIIPWELSEHGRLHWYEGD